MRATATLLVLAACSSARVGPGEMGRPTVTLPARLAEGSDAGAPPAPAASASASADAPDPPPLEAEVHLALDLLYDRGTVSVAAVRRERLRAPAAVPHHVGRHAIELFSGATLVERVRFDFPLLGAEPAPAGSARPLRETPRFAPGAVTRRTVRIPEHAEVDRATLVDRESGQRTDLGWPPAPAPRGE